MADNPNVVTVTDDSFADQIEASSGLTVIDFWATWCAPCKLIAPIIDDLATEYKDQLSVGRSLRCAIDSQCAVRKLDVDHNPNVAARFGVRSIPSVLFFKGKHIDTIVGAVPKPVLEQKVREHL